VILEGIVTTLDREGRLNIAPMGPKVDREMRRFVLRPFRSATTYRNLKSAGEGVFHVTDDALLLAKTAIGLPVDPVTRPADVVAGRILADACRYYEFRVVDLNDQDERTTIVVETLSEGRLRDFFGWNRAKHAIVEAAILATRLAILPLDEILAEFRRLAVPVEKTGGDAEHTAFRLLQEHVHDAARRRGLDPEHARP
jgi:hypothetical protein